METERASDYSAAEMAAELVFTRCHAADASQPSAGSQPGGQRRLPRVRWSKAPHLVPQKPVTTLRL